jgi:hypothetical protein
MTQTLLCTTEFYCSRIQCRYIIIPVGFAGFNSLLATHPISGRYYSPAY